MIFRSPSNPNSHLTIKERRWPSYPTKQLFQRGLIEGSILDFGCGLGTDVRFFESKGAKVKGYDPYYQPEYPNQKFDTILCNYVLNILLPEEQAHVLMAVSELLKPNGKAYYAVRRDIKRNGFRYNPKRECKTYQCNVILPYKSILRTEHCEIYEYQHFNQIPREKARITCAFCAPSTEQELITESATAYAMLKKDSPFRRPILVIPKRHSNDYFDLSFREQSACWLVVNRVRELMTLQHKPSGFRLEITSQVQKPSTGVHTHISMNLHFEENF